MPHLVVVSHKCAPKLISIFLQEVRKQLRLVRPEGEDLDGDGTDGEVAIDGPPAMPQTPELSEKPEPSPESATQLPFEEDAAKALYGKEEDISGDVGLGEKEVETYEEGDETTCDCSQSEPAIDLEDFGAPDDGLGFVLLFIYFIINFFFFFTFFFLLNIIMSIV